MTRETVEIPREELNKIYDTLRRALKFKFAIIDVLSPPFFGRDFNPDKIVDMRVEMQDKLNKVSKLVREFDI